MGNKEKILYIDLASPELQEKLQCKVVDKKSKTLSMKCTEKLMQEIQDSFNKNIPDRSPYKEYKVGKRFERGYYGQGLHDLGGGHEFGLVIETDPLTVSSGIAEIKAIYEPSSWTQAMIETLKKTKDEGVADDSLAEISGSIEMFNEIVNHGFNNLMNDFENVIGDEEITIEDPKTHKVKDAVKGSKKFSKNIELKDL